MYNKMNNLYFFVLLIIFIYKKILHHLKYTTDSFTVTCETDAVSSPILKITRIAIKAQISKQNLTKNVNYE